MRKYQRGIDREVASKPRAVSQSGCTDPDGLVAAHIHPRHLASQRVARAGGTAAIQ